MENTKQNAEMLRESLHEVLQDLEGQKTSFSDVF